MRLPAQSLCTGWGKSELEDWKTRVTGQWADVADCGDLTLECGIYRKSHSLSEAERDPIQ